MPQSLFTSSHRRVTPMSPSRPSPTSQPALLTRIGELAVDMSAVRRDLHQHPELAYHEQRTAAVVAKLLREWGIEVHEGIGKTGLVGVIAAGNSDRAIGLRSRRRGPSCRCPR